MEYTASATTLLRIKNMVCNRCIKVVKEEFENMGFEFEKLILGEVEIKGTIDQSQLNVIRVVLEKNGFELLDDKKSSLVEKIKNIIVQSVHYKDERSHFNFSELISDKLQMDYNYLSNLFSSMEGITIEKYIILQRIEKVKELLVYDELTLSEIAWKLGYSSVHHLSSQFKKVTGLTPSYFKTIKEDKRKALDQLG